MSGEIAPVRAPYRAPTTPPAHAAPTPDLTRFDVRAEGSHRFAYAKVIEESGEKIWRWPEKTALGAHFRDKGKVVDVTA